MRLKDILSLPEAAEFIGIRTKTLYYHIGKGAISTIQLGAGKNSRRYITISEAERFKAIPRLPGKKRKEPQPKRPRGRPPKPQPTEPPQKRPRGRPKKNS